MPRQDKGKRRDKQSRQLEHVEEGYAEHGLPDEEAERRAWATVNDVRYTADTLAGGYREADDMDR